MAVSVPAIVKSDIHWALDPQISDTKTRNEPKDPYEGNIM